MSNVKISKRQRTQYNHYIKVRSSIYDLFQRTRTFQLNFDKYLELKNDLYLNHPSLDKLNKYYRGYLEGIEDALFHILQTEWVEWLHYYKKVNGKTEYTKSWERIPINIRMNKRKGLVKSNHFWKNSKDINNPKPWGTDSEIF